MAGRFSRLAGCLLVFGVLLGAVGCAGFRLPWSAGRSAAQGPQLSASAAGLTVATAAPAATNRVAPVTAAKPAPAPVAKPAAPAAARTTTEAASASVGTAPYRLRPGDPVYIFLRGILPRDDEVEEVVDERGYVTLPYIDDVMAMGLTVSELGRLIQRTYIDRQIYKTITVNVVMPSQSYFVKGEVRQPQRYPLVTGTTMLQAIASAGGYTDYADPKRATLTRGGQVRVLNMREIERDPSKDVMIESGDVVTVPRSFF